MKCRKCGWQFSRKRDQLCGDEDDELLDGQCPYCGDPGLPEYHEMGPDAANCYAMSKDDIDAQEEETRARRNRLEE